MKILFISDFGFDVLVQSLLSGLVECGMDVIQYPYNPVYYGQTENWNRDDLQWFLKAEPPSWLGDVRDLPENDLVLNIWSLAPQGPQVQYTRLPLPPVLSEALILRMLSGKGFDLAVLVIGYLRSRQALVAAARLIDRERFPPTVVVDLSKEADVFSWDMAAKFSTVALFKNIMTKPDKRLNPLPLSSAVASKGKSFYFRLFGRRFRIDMPKEFDIHCNLSPTFPQRKALSEEVERLCQKHGWTRAPAGPYGENLLGIHKSKIAFSMRGSERDTLHYWEIPSFKTAMFCDGTMGAIHPHPFEDGKTAVFYDPEDFSDLEGLLVRYLSDDALRCSIAEAGWRHCATYHSNKARAAYFLDIVRKKVEARKEVVA